jgi:hypothetical protein
MTAGSPAAGGRAITGETSMFFRGRQPDASIWKRFRTSADPFTFAEADGVHTAHVVANAERVVDLFHSLSEHLPPAVDVTIDDLRSGRSWKGEGVAIPDAREAVARLKTLLVRHAGVEFSLFTNEDQLTLNPYLELFIYAKTDRWLYLLQGKGLEVQSRVEPKSWKTSRKQFPAAPELVHGLAAAVERLGLAPA